MTSMPRSRPSSTSVSGVPDARWPKVKFAPTTTARACNVSTSTRSTYSAGDHEEISSSKEMTTAASMPASPARAARWATVPSSGGTRSGLKISVGWGSNVHITAGTPSDRAAVTAREISSRCPRCTPSNTPMVTTEPVRSEGTLSSPCQISTPTRLRHHPSPRLCA